MISQDLRWHKNTKYICDKARSKLWILRRLLYFQLDIYTLFDVYCKEVRSILEMAVPVWHAGLTNKQTADIEKVQKLAFRIILRDKYVSYQVACATFSALTLAERRLQICSKFAKKNLKSENSFFTPIQKSINTRQTNKFVMEFRCNTKRYKTSSLPFLASVLNEKSTSNK